MYCPVMERLVSGCMRMLRRVRRYTWILGLGLSGLDDRKGELALSLIFIMM